MAKKITEITTEREFLGKLRTYYHSARRKGYQQAEIGFLGLMEYCGSATHEFEYYSDKYFSVGICAYDWQRGNSMLLAKVNEWEAEFTKEQKAKAARHSTTPTETPQISTQEPQVDSCATEGENAQERANISLSEVTLRNMADYPDKWPTVMCYRELLAAACRMFGCTIEEARDKCGKLTNEEWGRLLNNAPQTPETPPAVESAADSEKTPKNANKAANSVVKFCLTTGAGITQRSTANVPRKSRGPTGSPQRTIGKPKRIY